MDRAQMDRLVEAHLAAELVGNLDGCVAVYADDVEHDLVGAPAGPLLGRDEVRRFYERFRHELHTDEIVPIRAYYGEDFCVIEHEWRGAVPGAALGLEGGVLRGTFRVLHIWEFRAGLISRESAWFDVSSMLRLVPAGTR